ncbi:MAG: hypothetical protein J7604_24075 [Sporocytophaga sp.]|uniref:trypsin-like serine peptidase n=1 Tax=Sporocytophaga sp. TaxID=2231183 RepID=UPI001B1AF5CA|nr:hypothetical protein [Sporocytophaga sp.]MBO9703314.1 hypothetical protein [Sporocytophaga sp.]
MKSKNIKDSFDNRLPMLPDNFLLLENAKASKGIPKDFQSHFENRIFVHAREELLKSFSKSEQYPDTFEMVLPHGANIGLPVVNSERSSPEKIRTAITSQRNLEGFRPEWIDYAPHPKLAPLVSKIARTRKGELIETHDNGVFGADDRQVYHPTGYPWTCVGKLYIWDDFSKPDPQGSGSAVLVGDRVILTAGHAIPWHSKNWALKFVPAYYDGASTLGNGVYSWVSDCHGYDDPGGAFDMAVCRLYKPLGKSMGYFGAKTYDSDWEGGHYWTLAGYPGAIANANRPSRQMWWPILDDESHGDADELKYKADATSGDSGGPVFGFWDKEDWPSVVGTHIGTVNNWGNIGDGGSAMVDLIIWGKKHWT